MNEIEEKDIPNKDHRRRGGAFDLIAKTLKNIQEMLFSSGLIIRNRKGLPSSSGSNVVSDSVFEIYDSNAPKSGRFNLLYFGRGGIDSPDTKNTNYIELHANIKSEEDPASVNGSIFSVLSRDGVSSRSVFGIFDAEAVGSSGSDGITSLMSGEGSGGAIMAYVNESTGVAEDQLFVDENGIQGTGAYQNISDERTKKDIVDIEYGLEDVLKLRPIFYKRKTGNDKINIGLIAQEVKEVIPEIVGGKEESFYSIGYEGLIPVLINAIKELNARVVELEKHE